MFLILRTPHCIFLLFIFSLSIIHAGNGNKNINESTNNRKLTQSQYLEKLIKEEKFTKIAEKLKKKDHVSARNSSKLALIALLKEKKSTIEEIQRVSGECRFRMISEKYKIFLQELKDYFKTDEGKMRDERQNSDDYWLACFHHSVFFPPIKKEETKDTIKDFLIKYCQETLAEIKPIDEQLSQLHEDIQMINTISIMIDQKMHPKPRN